MIVIETLTCKISDFLNSNTCFCSWLCGDIVIDVEIVPRSGPPFWLMGSLFGWWNLEADPPLLGGCMLMNSRGGPHFGAVCWWILEADPPLGGCMLMNSRGRPLFLGCMLINSKGEPPFEGLYLDEFPFGRCMLMNFRGGSPFGAVCWWILEADPPPPFWEGVRL